MASEARASASWRCAEPFAPSRRLETAGAQI
jgi:hypothetical protein